MVETIASSFSHLHLNVGFSPGVFEISGMLNENVEYCRKAASNQIMSDTKKLRVAAIGVGSLGRHHARNYAELAGEGRVEFVGACDSNVETAKQIAAENGCTSFTEWKVLLDEVDVVSIATPTETHCEIARAFLDKG